ncbi:hypothetical protein Tco_0160668, partial [Tanacetum coccineum]
RKRLQDALIAKRISEEEELSEQQKKKKAKVQEAAQYYTEEDWDTIRVKLEANAELTKSLQGEKQKAKARRNKPMTQAKQRTYMATYLKNQGTWKPTQLKKLTFDELKTEFENLVKSIENFVPIETNERVKRQVIAKEEEIEKSVKKRGKIKKQNARKGIHS